MKLRLSLNIGILAPALTQSKGLSLIFRSRLLRLGRM